MKLKGKISDFGLCWWCKFSKKNVNTVRRTQVY